MLKKKTKFLRTNQCFSCYWFNQTQCVGLKFILWMNWIKMQGINGWKATGSLKPSSFSTLTTLIKLKMRWKLTTGSQSIEYKRDYHIHTQIHTQFFSLFLLLLTVYWLRRFSLSLLRLCFDFGMRRLVVLEWWKASDLHVPNIQNETFRRNVFACVFVC